VDSRGCNDFSHSLLGLELCLDRNIIPVSEQVELRDVQSGLKSSERLRTSENIESMVTSIRLMLKMVTACFFLSFLFACQ
jgi:hypothetical protein